MLDSRSSRASGAAIRGTSRRSRVAGTENDIPGLLWVAAALIAFGASFGSGWHTTILNTLVPTDVEPGSIRHGASAQAGRSPPSTAHRYPFYGLRALRGNCAMWVALGRRLALRQGGPLPRRARRPPQLADLNLDTASIELLTTMTIVGAAIASFLDVVPRSIG